MAEDVPRSRGVVRRFSELKGYGFIKPDEGGDDLFVHHSDIKSEGYRTLQPGQVVEFFVELDNDKTKAVDVTGPNGSSLDKARNGGARGGGRGGGGYGYGNDAEGRYGGYRGGGGSGGGGGGSGGECYKCGEYGHIARDCEQEGGGRRGGGRGDGACFNCGGIGHMARDCTSARLTGGGGCYTCGEHGHIARECPNEAGGSGFDRYGGGGGGRGFDRYGGGGRRFDRFGGRGGGGGGGSCYNCGDPGHFARDCPTS